MREIFNDKNLPGERISGRVVVDPADGHAPIGGMIHCAMRNMARDLADKMVRNEKFFKAAGIPGMPLVEISADLIVMTPGELKAFAIDCYRASSDPFHVMTEYAR